MIFEIDTTNEPNEFNWNNVAAKSYVCDWLCVFHEEEDIWKSEAARVGERESVRARMEQRKFP